MNGTEPRITLSIAKDVAQDVVGLPQTIPPAMRDHFRQEYKGWIQVVVNKEVIDIDVEDVKM